MDYLSITTCFLLLLCLYINRNTVLFNERSLEYLIIGFILMLVAIFLLMAFLTEFIGIIFFIFALVLFLNSLIKEAY